jgi:heme/copper-type cytochrome/quinol oxidase subunit 2
VEPIFLFPERIQKTFIKIPLASNICIYNINILFSDLEEIHLNLLLIFTTAVVLMMTSYSIYLVHREKNKVTLIPGIIISMAVATMTGLLSGFLIGIFTGDLFLSFGVSLIIGFTIGFLAGQPIGLPAILNGALAGLMSSLMGSLFGILLQFTSPAVILGILLALYVLILGLVIVFIKVETNENLSLDTQNISPFAVAAAGVALVTLFLFLYSSDMVKIPNENTTEQTQTASSQPVSEIDVTKDSTPKIQMKVTQSGYTPNVIRVRKGVSVELIIDNPLEDSCLSTFTMPDFNLNNFNLKVGKTNLSFTPDKTGTYTFSCGMQMYKGTIIVVD